MDYTEKYLKYKKKYLLLKNMRGGEITIGSLMKKIKKLKETKKQTAMSSDMVDKIDFEIKEKTRLLTELIENNNPSKKIEKNKPTEVNNNSYNSLPEKMASSMKTTSTVNNATENANPVVSREPTRGMTREDIINYGKSSAPVSTKSSAPVSTKSSAPVSTKSSPPVSKEQIKVEVDEETKRNHYGEILYPDIHLIIGDKLSGKITGMLIEMTSADLEDIVNNKFSLIEKMIESISVLQGYDVEKLRFVSSDYDEALEKINDYRRSLSSSPTTAALIKSEESLLKLPKVWFYCGKEGVCNEYPQNIQDILNSNESHTGISIGNCTHNINVQTGKVYEVCNESTNVYSLCIRGHNGIITKYSVNPLLSKVNNEDFVESGSDKKWGFRHYAKMPTQYSDENQNIINSAQQEGFKYVNVTHYNTRGTDPGRGRNHTIKFDTRKIITAPINGKVEIFQLLRKPSYEFYKATSNESYSDIDKVRPIVWNFMHERLTRIVDKLLPIVARYSSSVRKELFYGSHGLLNIILLKLLYQTFHEDIFGSYTSDINYNQLLALYDQDIFNIVGSIHPDRSIKNNTNIDKDVLESKVDSFLNEITSFLMDGVSEYNGFSKADNSLIQRFFVKKLQRSVLTEIIFDKLQEFKLFYNRNDLLF
jgi:hypothetical protein